MFYLQQLSAMNRRINNVFNTTPKPKDLTAVRVTLFWVFATCRLTRIPKFRRRVLSPSSGFQYNMAHEQPSSRATEDSSCLCAMWCCRTPFYCHNKKGRHAPVPLRFASPSIMFINIICTVFICFVVAKIKGGTVGWMPSVKSPCGNDSVLAGDIICAAQVKSK